MKGKGKRFVEYAVFGGSWFSRRRDSRMGSCGIDTPLDRDRNLSLRFVRRRG